MLSRATNIDVVATYVLCDFRSARMSCFHGRNDICTSIVGVQSTLSRKTRQLNGRPRRNVYIMDSVHKDHRSVKVDSSGMQFERNVICILIGCVSNYIITGVCERGGQTCPGIFLVYIII